MNPKGVLVLKGMARGLVLRRVCQGVEFRVNMHQKGLQDKQQISDGGQILFNLSEKGRKAWNK